MATVLPSTVQSPLAFGFGHYATVVERGTLENRGRIEYSPRICSERVPRVYTSFTHNTAQARLRNSRVRTFRQASSGSALGRITLWGATGLRPCQCPFVKKLLSHGCGSLFDNCWLLQLVRQKERTAGKSRRKNHVDEGTV
jgi:hypothetical protein